MIVDDNVDAAETLAEMLRMANYDGFQLATTVRNDDKLRAVLLIAEIRDRSP